MPIKLLVSVIIMTSVTSTVAFMDQNPPTTTNCQLTIPRRTPLFAFKIFGGSSDKYERDHITAQSKPHIIELVNPEEYKQFLEADDRLSAIKIHASWCKSCKLFGKQYERIGKEIGDLVAIDDGSTITRKGEIRLAEIEYGKNGKLCKSLGVKKVPSIFFYYRGKKLDGFPCGPKKIAHTLERLNYYRSLSPAELIFEAEMAEGSELGDQLLDRLLSRKQDSDRDQDSSQTKQSDSAKTQ